MQIKFSQTYDKMLNNPFEETPKKAVLLEVFVKSSKELHPRFVEYDTIYFNEKVNNSEYYKLPQGDVIILLLKSEFVNGEVMLWTTIRRFTPEKYQYYNKARLNEFDIVIEQDEVKPNSSHD